MNKIIKTYIRYISYDTPRNSSRDPKVGLRAKQWEKKKVRAHLLTRNTSGVRGCARALRWD